MAWRLAKSLEKLREEVNAKWPNRSKVSDGTIGDEAHQSSSSDHNPHVRDGSMGVVTAMDITHDPAHGLDSEQLAEALRRSKDSRIKYIISNRKIASSETAPWEWRPYTGKNPHNHHVHISVKSDKVHYDSTVTWPLDGVAIAPVANAPQVRPMLRKGAEGNTVGELQTMLNKHGASLKVDDDFGKATEAAVKTFQKINGLVADGVVGPYTFEKLEGK